MPIYNIGSPIAAGLGGAQAYLDAVTKKKQEEYQRQQTAMAQARQAQIDAQNKAYQDEQQAYQQAQLGMSRDAATRGAALDKARLGEMGYDASGNPISSPITQAIKGILGLDNTPNTNATPSAATPSMPQTYPGVGGIGGNVTMSNGMTPSAYGATLGAAAGAAARPGAGTSNLPSLQSIAPTAPAEEPLTLNNLPTDRPLTYAEQQQFRAPLEDQLQKLFLARSKTTIPSEVSKYDRAIEGVRNQQQLVDKRLKDANDGYKANFAQQEAAFQRNEQPLPSGEDIPSLQKRLSTLQKRLNIENQHGYFEAAKITQGLIKETSSDLRNAKTFAANQENRNERIAISRSRVASGQQPATSLPQSAQNLIDQVASGSLDSTMARRQAEQLNPPLTRAQMSDFVSQVGSENSKVNQQRSRDYNFASNALTGIPSDLKNQILKQIYEGASISQIKSALQKYVDNGGKGADGKTDPSIGSLDDAKRILKAL